ncbi:uncharacterized protein LOC113333335 [Papaver somniferum]|uniref:uncharacterized protein LOC113333335 n=1 Tax=Papaver somniferum TaxID=3469 RepID=UPI000E703DCC|nr:uncharacterized protein LOC113333335 [Papaver somniferum]
MVIKVILWVFMVMMSTTYIGKTEGYLCYWDCVDACKVSGPECWYPCLDYCNPPLLSRTGDAPAMSPEISEAPSTSKDITAQLAKEFGATIAEDVFTSKVNTKEGMGQPIKTEDFFFFGRPSNRKLIPRQ